jgi:hypothetical protein
MKTFPKLPAFGLLHHGSWPDASFDTRSNLHSALNATLPLPIGWATRASERVISARPVRCDLPAGIEPFEWLCERVQPNTLRRFALDRASAIEACGGRIVQRTALTTPYDACVIDFDLSLSGSIVRGRHIAAAFDDGQLCCAITCADWVEHVDALTVGAAQIWRSLAVCAPTLPRGWRRFVNERAGWQCAAPAAWCDDHSGDTLLVLRKPGAPRAQPALIVQSDFASGRARSAAELAHGLSGLSIEIDIGNRSGLAVILPSALQTAENRELHVLVPEPSKRAAHVIQVYCDAEETDLLDQLRCCFRWTADC